MKTKSTKNNAPRNFHARAMTQRSKRFDVGNGNRRPLEMARFIMDEQMGDSAPDFTDWDEV